MATNLVYADRGSKRGRVNIVATKVVVRDGGKGIKVTNKIGVFCNVGCYKEMCYLYARE